MLIFSEKMLLLSLFRYISFIFCYYFDILKTDFIAIIIFMSYIFSKFQFMKRISHYLVVEDIKNIVWEAPLRHIYVYRSKWNISDVSLSRSFFSSTNLKRRRKKTDESNTNAIFKSNWQVFFCVFKKREKW